MMAFITTASAGAMPASPPPLTRSGIALRRVLGQRDVERRHKFGARNAVVHEAASQHLAVVVIAHVLEQRLADALHDAAMDLAVQD